MQAKWTPQPGELVEWNGTWIFLAFDFGNPCSSRWHPEWIKSIRSDATPLLPACNSMAEAWEALWGGALAGTDHFPGGGGPPDSISIPVENGELLVDEGSTDVGYDGPIPVIDENADVVDRDLHKRRTLSEWLAGVQQREADND